MAHLSTGTNKVRTCQRRLRDQPRLILWKGCSLCEKREWSAKSGWLGQSEIARSVIGPAVRLSHVLRTALSRLKLDCNPLTDTSSPWVYQVVILQAWSDFDITHQQCCPDGSFGDEECPDAKCRRSPTTFHAFTEDPRFLRFNAARYLPSPRPRPPSFLTTSMQLAEWV